MQQGTLGLAPRNCKGRFPSTGHGHAGPAPAYVEATCRYQRDRSSERRAVPVLCSSRRNEPRGQDKDEGAPENRSFHVHSCLGTDLREMLARRLLSQCARAFTMKASYMTIKRGPRPVTTGDVPPPLERDEDDNVADDFLASDEEEVYLVLWYQLVEASGSLEERPDEPGINVACTVNSTGSTGPESVLGGSVRVRDRVYRRGRKESASAKGPE